MNAIKKLHQILASELTKVNEIIDGYLDREEEPLIKSIGNYLMDSRGKQIRVILTIVSARLCNYQGEGHLMLAAAIELIHNSTLLHDDVVDNSDLRRNKASSHIIWGNKAAILVGDYLFSLSFRLMVRTKSLRALERLSEASSKIARGEVMQMSKKTDDLFSEEFYYKIIEAKTAELFAAACETGPILCDRPFVKEMGEYGNKLGLIFQITDDVLDYIAVDDKFGKNVGDDFFEKKITLPVILAYKNGNDNEKSFLKEIFAEDNELTEGNFKQVVELISTSKVQEALNKKLKELSDDSEIILDSLKNVDENSRNMLKELSKFALERMY